MRLRKELTERAARWQADLKLVEVPPGPPVLSTITAEVYGPPTASYNSLIDVAQVVRDRLAAEPGVVDVDFSSQADQTQWVFETDKPKAALSGISTQQIVETLQTALGGNRSAWMRQPQEVTPLPIVLRLPREQRSALETCWNCTSVVAKETWFSSAD